jgi:hypothetical protein
MDRTGQRYVMKFLLMDGRKYKTIHTELSQILKGHALSVDVCKYWCWKFKACDFSMDDWVRSGRPPIELSGAIMSLLSNEPFPSARIFAVRFSSTHQTIKVVLVSDLGMRKLVRWWIPHDLSEVNRRERVLKVNLLLEELQADEGMNSRTQWLVMRASSVLVTNPIPSLQRLHSIFDQVTFEDMQRVFLNWMERLS